MTLEDHILLACTRQEFRDSHRKAVEMVCRSKEVRWDQLYLTACQHGVTPLVYTNLVQCTAILPRIPAAIRAQFKKSLMYNVEVKSYTAGETKRLLGLLQRIAVEVMLVKGAALAIEVYREPWYTLTDDVDLVIKPSAAMSDPLVYHKVETIIAAFNLSGNPLAQHLEVDYYTHHDVTMNGVLRVDWNIVWRDAVKITFEAQPVWLMSAEDTLIAACINACRKRFFKLKALCDIAEIIQAWPHLSWDTVVHKTQSYDCHSIVFTALTVVQATLGCTVPAEALDKLSVPKLKQELIHLLVDQLLQRNSFSSLIPGTAPKLLERKLSLPLLLTYVTYRPYQVGRKMGEIYRGWRIRR